MIEHIDEKKTTLEDDASIYQKREDREESKSVKEKWSQLDRKGKWQFFVDYYLLKLIFVLFFGGIIISLLYTMLKPKPDELTYIALLDNRLDAVSVEEFFEKCVTDDMGLDAKKYTITCNTSLLSDSTSDASTISTFMFAGAIDIFIAPKDALTRYVETKTLLAFDLDLPEDIRAILTEDDFYYAVSPIDNNSHVFGICLDDTPFIQATEREGTNTSYYLAFTTNGDNVKDGDAWNTVRCILGLPTVGAPKEDNK